MKILRIVILAATLALSGSGYSFAAASAVCMGPCVILPGFELGMGATYMTVDSNALKRKEQRAGYSFYLGQRVLERLVLEVSIDAAGGYLPTKATTDIYYPEDSAEFSTVNYGIKFDFLPIRKSRWTPWLGFGFSDVLLSWKTYWYSLSGWTNYGALGVDWLAGEHYLLRARYLSSLSPAETGDYYGHQTPPISFRTLALTFIYEF